MNIPEPVKAQKPVKTVEAPIVVVMQPAASVTVEAVPMRPEPLISMPAAPSMLEMLAIPGLEGMPILSPEAEDRREQAEQEEYIDLLRKKQAMMSIPALNLAQIDEDAATEKACTGANCPSDKNVEAAKVRNDKDKATSLNAKTALDQRAIKEATARAHNDENASKLQEEKRKTEKL